MEKNQKLSQENDVIDLGYLFKILLKRAWAIIAIALIVAIGALGYTKLFIKPKYSSSVMLYVNNRNMTVGNISISASELSAAQSLVDTYVIILNNRTTVNAIKEKAGVDDSWQSILGSIKAEPVEGTEIFKVTVTTINAEKSAKIANAITEVLPERIEEVIDGSSMRVVDSAVVNNAKVSPNTTTNTIIGFALGFVLACGLFVVLAMLDDTIQDEDYITQTFDKPLLAQIPDLMFDDEVERKSRYGYSYAKSKATDK